MFLDLYEPGITRILAVIIDPERERRELLRRSQASPPTIAIVRDITAPQVPTPRILPHEAKSLERLLPPSKGHPGDRRRSIRSKMELYGPPPGPAQSVSSNGSPLSSHVGDLASTDLYVDTGTTGEALSAQDQGSQSGSNVPAVPAACLACVSDSLTFPLLVLGVHYEHDKSPPQPVGFIGLTYDPHT